MWFQKNSPKLPGFLYGYK